MTKITIDRSVVEQALEALDAYSWEQVHAATTALRQALKQAKPPRHISYVCPQCYWTLEEKEQSNEFHPDWDQIKPFHDRIAELEKVVRQALGALEGVVHAHGYKGGTPVEAITALRQALEQSAERVEPVATLWQHGETGRTRITTPDEITDCDARWFKAADLYTHPTVIDKSAAIRIATALGWEPKKEWVGLTDDEVLDALRYEFSDVRWPSTALDVSKIIESKLKEKNT